MGFTQKFRLFFHRNSIKNQLKQRSGTNTRKAGNFEKASHIGILFNATDLDERKKVTKYADQLRKKGKRVHLLAFINNRTETSNFTFDYFNLKQVDWAMRPSGPAVRDFMDQKFDVLLNLSRKSDIYFEYICTLSKAKLRVGPVAENTQAYDLMMDVPKPVDFLSYTQKIEELLMKTSVSYHEN